MRTFFLTVEIDDNDLVEHAFCKEIEVMFGSALKSIKKLPNTDKLYEDDPVFRKLVKARKDGKTEVENYINKHNH